MSRVTDLARAEADAIEAVEEEENPTEPEPEPEPEPTPEPEPEPPPDVGKMQKAIERVHGNYEAALKKVPGLMFDAYQPCENCGSMGYVLPSDQPEFEYQRAPDKDTCPECAGAGLVISGARNENHALEQCSKCNGNGWVTIARPEPVRYAETTGVPAPTMLDQNGGPQPVNDAWDRPWGHPHYGVPPAMVRS